MKFPTDKELDEIERYMQEEKLLTPVTTSEAKRLIAAARDRNRLERGYLSDDSCPRCAPLAAENRAFHEDRRVTVELAEAHRRLTTELAEARARLIPEEERRKLEGDVLTAESASAELRDQLERVQRELGKARADLFARGALIASITKERDEAVDHDAAIEVMLTGTQAEVRQLRAERDECAARLTQEVIDFDRTARELSAIRADRLAAATETMRKFRLRLYRILKEEACFTESVVARLAVITDETLYEIEQRGFDGD